MRRNLAVGAVAGGLAVSGVAMAQSAAAQPGDVNNLSNVSGSISSDICQGAEAQTYLMATADGPHLDVITAWGFAGAGDCDVRIRVVYVNAQGVLTASVYDHVTQGGDAARIETVGERCHTEVGVKRGDGTWHTGRQVNSSASGNCSGVITY